MKTVRPNDRDLSETELAIRSFPDAWGSVRPGGEFTPTIMDPAVLWIMFQITAEGMAEMWCRAGINSGDKSSFSEMKNAADHTVCVRFFKCKTGFLRTGWVGNVYLGFDKSEIGIGSIAGHTQADMWRQLRSFIDGDATLHDSTAGAVTTLK